MRKATNSLMPGSFPSLPGMIIFPVIKIYTVVKVFLCHTGLGLHILAAVLKNSDIIFGFTLKKIAGQDHFFCL